MSDFLLFTVIAAALVVPLRFAIQWEIRRVVSADDDRIRRTVREASLCDELGPVIGFFNGSTIYASVKYMGSLYVYDRVAPPRYDRDLASNELLLDPGLVYISA